MFVSGPIGGDRAELQHRAKRDDWSRCRGGGRGPDQTVHGSEGSQGPVPLLVRELHRGLELLRGTVGQYWTGTGPTLGLGQD